MTISIIARASSARRHVRSAATAALLGSALISGVAFATPGSGVTPSNKIVSGAADIFARVYGNYLFFVVGSDHSPINILNVTQTFAPGGFSGWHTHAGPGFVIVSVGTITIEETAGCFVDYPQGSVLFEGGPGHIHNALNRTATPVQLDAIFFLPAVLPAGSNSRIDEPVQYGDGTCNSKKD